MFDIGDALGVHCSLSFAKQDKQSFGKRTPTVYFLRRVHMVAAVVCEVAHDDLVPLLLLIRSSAI